ncbi:hypothetical protein BD779DRAFT_1669455 [Infundibulicybe gibba]|nr:hypothetical protein BD779DRAFT_1669455 [Infundibulicybe gibba]
MPTESAKLHKFPVYAPDKVEKGTLEKRFEVRSRHLAGVAPKIAAGIIQVGGMLVTPESVESDTAKKQATGSILIVQAESLNQVREMIESDIYYTSGVWDNEKIVISPFLPATPFPN